MKAKCTLKGSHDSGRIVYSASFKSPEMPTAAVFGQGSTIFIDKETYDAIEVGKTYEITFTQTDEANNVEEFLRRCELSSKARLVTPIRMRDQVL